MTGTLDQPRTAAPADPAAAVAVFHDAACPVCRREIAVYRRMTGAEAIDWADAAEAEPPAGLTRADLLARFTVLRADGRVARGAEGFAALWRAFPALAPLGRIADTRPALWVGEPLYRLFLRLRRLWR